MELSNNYRLRRLIHTESSEYHQLDLIKNPNEIDFQVRTLLLIHGALSSIDKSFKDLLSMSPSFLASLMGPVYQQILFFDHDSWGDRPEKNANYLNDVLFGGNRFSGNNLDLLTTSRGSLVAFDLTILNPRMDIGKVIMFSPGGCGYLTSLDGISKWLTLISKIDPSSILDILALITSGATALLRTSGMQDSFPNSTFLSTAYSTDLRYPVEFRSMSADYHQRLYDKETDEFKRFVCKALSGGADLALKLFLGKEHDWVIGRREQNMQIQGSNATSTNTEFKCRHGRYFRPHYPLQENHPNQDYMLFDEIYQFLSSPPIFQ